MSRHGDNVFSIRPQQQIDHDDLPVPVEELAETVSAIRLFLDKLGSGSQSTTGFGETGASSALLQMPVVEEHLEELVDITVANWPDVRWAMRFCDARVRALASLRSWALFATRTCIPAQSGHQPTGTGTTAVSRALRDVRNLIVERYPQTTWAD